MINACVTGNPRASRNLIVLALATHVGLGGKRITSLHLLSPGKYLRSGNEPWRLCHGNQAMCLQLQHFCVAVDDAIAVHGLTATATIVAKNNWSPYHQHQFANILAHTFGAHISQNMFNTSDLLMIMKHFKEEGVPDEGNAFPHGMLWQTVIRHQLSLCASRKTHVPCSFAFGAFSQLAKSIVHDCRLLLGNVSVGPICLHGVGHGAMIASLALHRQWKYEACEPLKFHQHLLVRDLELGAALDACDTIAEVPNSAHCAGGVYHTYTSISVPSLPLNTSWYFACSRAVRHASMCFEFTMQNYDVEDLVRDYRGDEKRLIHPVSCLDHLMENEATIRGCIFTASQEWGRRQLYQDELCEQVAQASAADFKWQRWALCWSGDLHDNVPDKCHTMQAQRPEARPYVHDVCTSMSEGFFFSTYPYHLLMALPGT